jgi:hypothetical protein
MALTMRPTGLGVYSGGWNIGRIYETRGSP